MTGLAEITALMNKMTEEERAVFKTESGTLAKVLSAGTPMMHMMELANAATKIDAILSKYQTDPECTETVNSLKNQAIGIQSKLMSGDTASAEEIKQLEDISKIQIGNVSNDKALADEQAKKEEEEKKNVAANGMTGGLDAWIEKMMGMLVALIAKALGGDSDDKKKGIQSETEPLITSTTTDQGNPEQSPAQTDPQTLSEEQKKAAHAAAGGLNDRASLVEAGGKGSIPMQAGHVQANGKA